jgi:glycosyltransferase involved in cell wall biosynthesis
LDVYHVRWAERACCTEVPRQPAKLKWEINNEADFCVKAGFPKGSHMKILMLSPQPFFEPRGTPISVYQRLEALSALGHHIDLVTYHLGKDVAFPNVRIYRVRKVKMIQNVRIGPSRAKLFLDALMFLKVFRMLLTRRYDVIHSHEEGAFFGILLAKLFRTRHLYDMHSVLSKQLGNFDFGNKPVFVKIFEALEIMVLKSSDAVINVGADLDEYINAVDPEIQRITIENVALHAYQTSIEPEAVAELTERLKLHSRIPILYTGTFERYQGLDMVLECAGRVVKQHPNAIFIFVGAKVNQAQEWTEKAAAKNLGNHTLFLDAVPPEDSMVYLAYASILISPRLNGTTIPLKVYSYLHAGRPIVATNINAHTQVLTPDTAVLVYPSADAFADGILKLLADPELGEYLGENAHRLAQEKFNYQNYTLKVTQIYKTLETGVKLKLPSVTQE